VFENGSERGDARVKKRERRKLEVRAPPFPLDAENRSWEDYRSKSYPDHGRWARKWCSTRDRTCFVHGYRRLLTWFERDPSLDKLRKDSRFIEVLDKLRPRFERLKTLAQTGIPVNK